MKKLVVCFVINEFSFYVSHRIQLARILSKHFKVSVLTDLSGVNSQTINSVNSDKISLIDVKKRSGSLIFKNYLRYFLDLRKSINQLNPDFILYVSLETCLFGIFIKLLTRAKKSLFLITGRGSNYTYKTLKSKLIRLIYFIAFSLIKLKKDYLIIFQNSHDKNLFLNNYALSEDKTRIILGSGIDTEHFNFIERKVPKKIAFLFASRLLEEKGLIEFFAASEIITSKYSECKFIVAGNHNSTHPSSVSKNYLEKLIKSPHISFLGEIEFNAMNLLYQQSSIFVLPSYGEGLPKAALEAASTGMPLILTDVPGCIECVEVEKNGFLVEPKDAVDLANKMEKFLLNPKIIPEMSKCSRKKVREQFSLEKISNKYLEILNI